VRRASHETYRVRWLPAVELVLACALSLTAVSAHAKRPRCLVSVDDKKGELRINRVTLPTFDLAALPKQVFRGVLKINGNTVDPQRPPVPGGVGYRTTKFPLFGASFAPTSLGMVVDSIYAYAGQLAIRIFLDSASNKRVAYVRLR
jgi:hypothetical protein